MTFTVLRALYGIIGEALDDIESVYHAHGQEDTATDPVAVDNGDNTDTPELSARGKLSPPSPQSSPSSPTSSSRNSAFNATTKPSGALRHHKPSLSASSMSAICKAYVSPPPSPCVTTKEQRFDLRVPPMAVPTGRNRTSTTTKGMDPAPAPALDFPSLDAPFDAASASEMLTSHPIVMAAINRIISACGQMTATVQTPFLTVCDSTMGYHLPSCMRIVEAAHVVEILREHGPPGMHVDRISQLCGVDASKLAHILRLLATHHIFNEVSPDVFSLNRISSLIDSGKSIDQLTEYRTLRRPELKYQGTNGIAAFVGLCSDEINKASAYMTETYLLSTSQRIREANQPTLAPFCVAFGTVDRNIDYFGWLEGEDEDSWSQSVSDIGTEQGHGANYAPAPGLPERPTDSSADAKPIPNLNRFRLERFGKAMAGTGSWEAPGAVFNGFDWGSLPRGSVVVDVGGGIGSTSMLLASAFSPQAGGDDLGLKFVIQDRAVVCEMGKKAWREKCPELLEAGAASFQVHDFFTPQPVRDAAVFLLRVVLHDWPDDLARKILLHLRAAATPQTKLLLADFVLPLACADDLTSESGLEGMEGAQRELAPAPLLPNLGKASANVYWMDLTMNVMFNSRERTLREIVALCLSAGWRVVKLTQAPGSLFGYIIAVPIVSSSLSSPVNRHLNRHAARNGGMAPSTSTSAQQQQHSLSGPGRRLIPESRLWGSSMDKEGERRAPRDRLDAYGDDDDAAVVQRSSSRCGTPTFGSRTELSSVAEALAKFGGGVKRYRGPGVRGRKLSSGDPRSSPSSSPGSSSSLAFPVSPLKPAVSLNVVKKPRPPFPPLSIVPSPESPSSSRTPKRTPSPSPINLQIAASPRQPPPPTPPKSLRRPASLANLKTKSDFLSSSADVPPLPPPLSAAQLAAFPLPSPPGAGVGGSASRVILEARPGSPQPSSCRLGALRTRASLAQLSPRKLYGEPEVVPPLPSSPSYIPIRSHVQQSTSSSLKGSQHRRTSLQQSAIGPTPVVGAGVPPPAPLSQSSSSTSPTLSGIAARKRASTTVQKPVNLAAAAAVVPPSSSINGRANQRTHYSGGSGNAVPVPTVLGSPLSVRGDRSVSASASGGVASYLRGAGQRLGGILRFEGRGEDKGVDSDKRRSAGVGGPGVLGLADAVKIERGEKVKVKAQDHSP